MKKSFVFFALFLTLCLASCQKEVIEQIEYDMNTDNEYYIETRSRVPVTPPIPANVIASGAANNLPDPRMQIRGIPIWIYLREGVVAANRQYLSAIPAANGVGRVALSSDPNHVRARWVLEEIPGLAPPRVPGSWVGYGHRLRSMFTGNDAGFIASPPRIVPRDRIDEFVAITPTFERVGSNANIEYRINITYIATLRGKTTGRQIILTGTWESAIVQEVSANHIFPNGHVIQGAQPQRQNITRTIH